MNLKEVAKELEEIENENKRLRNLKERYIEFADRLDNLGNELKSIAKDIDPVQGIRSRSYSGIDYEPFVSEIAQKMREGVHVSTELIDKTYPDLTQSNRHYIWQLVQKLGGVQKRKDRRTVYLYFLNT